MAKCIRCGKPCNDGENMCDECKAWFQEKTGGAPIAKPKNPKPGQSSGEKVTVRDNKTPGQNRTSGQNRTPDDNKNNSGGFLKILIVILAVVLIGAIGATVAVVKQKKQKAAISDGEMRREEVAEKSGEETEEPGEEPEEEPEEIEEEPEEESEEEPEEEPEVEVRIRSTYEYIKKDISWNNAAWEAEQKGGHLAVITSEEEFDKICDIAYESGLTYIWLGARIYSPSDDWDEEGWITGEEWTFDYWYPGEPSRYDSGDNAEELYLCLWHAKYNDKEIGWTFNDQRDDIISVLPTISGKIGYIVEYEEIEYYEK